MTPERLKELTDMVNSENYLARIKATEALDLPLELQEILARDKDVYVLWQLANNTSVVNVEIQEILARDKCWEVRWHLACNTSFTDHKLWELLRNDKDKDVRDQINYRINQEKDKIKQEFKEKINR